MARFLTGYSLKENVTEIIRYAEKELVIVSPYIKLHTVYRKHLIDRVEDLDLKILVLFRKSNHLDRPYSYITNGDLELLKIFKNIEIRCIKDLHAKCYMNEGVLLVTSMNMYEYSQLRNIEFGIQLSLAENQEFNKEDVVMKMAILKEIERLRKKSEIVYQYLRDPGTELFGFEKERLHVDNTGKAAEATSFHINQLDQVPTQGYCIRTGESILFNMKMPYSAKAYRTCLREGSLGVSEQYCHLSGERSLGSTTFYKPVILKYWVELNRKFPTVAY